MADETPPVCNYEGSDYQESFWEKGGRDYEDAAEEIALRRLLPISGHHLLELGAGAGRNTLRYTGFEHITLVDYSLTQLQQARSRLGDSSRYRYVAADIYHLPFVANLFEGATMIRTLHHMQDAPLSLKQVRNCLKQNAFFILEYANKQNLKAIARYAFGKQSWSPFAHEPVEFAALNFDFHPAAIRQWLGETGFQLERQLTVSHFRVGIVKRIIPPKSLAMLDSLVSLTGNFWQLTPSVFSLSTAIGGNNAEPDGFFRCPACGDNHLGDTPPELVCGVCGKHYPVIGGIYDFRST